MLKSYGIVNELTGAVGRTNALAGGAMAGMKKTAV
jgi:hypothetical protein